MTNVEEIFEEIASKGQHPRMVSDTYILLEQLGHRLDRESERNFVEAQKMGLEGTEITKYIEDHINVANILKQAAPIWDGGYVLCGVTGSGEMFTLRDPWGIRPAFWYKNDELLVVASERPVIQTSLDLEAEEIHELKPGEGLIMSKDGQFRTEQILTPKNLAACSFERVYFSRGSDKDIYQERKALGRTLVAPILKAVDGELDQTVFSYIPNTAEAAYYGLLEGFDNFLPSDFNKELNGKGFKGPLGEFRLAAFPAFSKVVSLKSFFLQTLENILQAEEVERLVVVGDDEECGEEIADRLTKNPDKEVTILTTAPIKGEGFKQDLLGYSLTRALGISPDEMQ